MQRQRGAEAVVGVQAIRGAVQVPHHHHVLEWLDQLAEVVELQVLGALAQGQVGDEQVQGLGALAEARMDGAPAGQGSRQAVLLDAAGCQPGEQAIAVLGKSTEVAVELLIVVGEAALHGQVLELIDLVRAKAAAVHLL